MKSTTIKPVIFAIAFVVAFGASVVSAQETRVEIVDVAKVFKNSSGDFSGMHRLSAKADQLKKQILAEQAGLKPNQMTADLKQPTWQPTIRSCWVSISKLANSFNVFGL